MKSVFKIKLNMGKKSFSFLFFYTILLSECNNHDLYCSENCRMGGVYENIR